MKTADGASASRFLLKNEQQSERDEQFVVRFFLKKEEEQQKKHQICAVEILKMKLFQYAIEKTEALFKRAAPRFISDRRHFLPGRRRSAARRFARLQWGRGRFAVRRPVLLRWCGTAFFLLRDAGIYALIVAQITVVHAYPSRVVRNILARWMSLASCAARATLSRRFSRRKGWSA